MNPPRVSRVLAALAVLVPLALLRAQDNPGPKQYGYTVTVELKVDDKGEPLQPETVAASEDPTPDHYLDAMALLMASKTHFPPHLKDGKPVAFKARVPFFFPIEGDKGPEAQKEPMAHPRMEPGKAIMPIFPPDLAAKGEVGGVILELSVDAEGKVTELKTLRASNPEFEQAALTAVKNWTFNPAREGERPVASQFSVAVVFDTGADKADLKWRIAPRPSLGSFIVIPPPPAPAAAMAPSQPVPSALAREPQTGAPPAVPAPAEKTEPGK